MIWDKLFHFFCKYDDFIRKYDILIKQGDDRMRLVMFDLDGTLLSNMHGISEGNRIAFRKLYNQGYK